MIDYGILRLIWWALIGVLLIGFAILDGFDIGVAILHPFVARKDVERRVTMSAIGPVWEGNQIWFVLGGGAVFAAWPLLYAVSFSGFYLAMMLVLVGFILRPVALTYRSKRPSPAWRVLLGLGLLRLGPHSRARLRRRLRQSAARRALPFREGAQRRL